MTTSAHVTALTPEPTRRRRRRPVYAAIMALTGVCFWSTNALAGGVVLASVPLSVVVAVQFVVATITLAVFKIVRSHVGTRGRLPAKTFTRSEWMAAAALGLIGLAGTMTLQYVAFAHAPIVEANIVAYAWPMVAALYLAMTARTASSMAGLGLAMLGFVGVIFILTGHTSTADDGSGSLGHLAAVISAICMAFYTLGSSRVKVPATDLMLIGTVLGSIGSVAFVAITQPAVTLSPAILPAIYVGAGPVAAGYLLWSLGMAASRGRLAPLGYATPLLSTCVLLLSGRQFGDSTVIGALMVLICTIGVLAADRFMGDRRL